MSHLYLTTTNSTTTKQQSPTTLISRSSDSQKDPKKGNRASPLDITTVISAAHSYFYNDWEWQPLKYYLQNIARQAFSNNRLNACLRVIAHNKLTVDIVVESQRAHYRNLCRCANVWLCPVCSDTVTAYRRQLMAAKLAEYDLTYAMVTLTMRHHREMSLKETIQILTKAYHATFRNRPGRRLKSDYGVVGTIKSLEVTRTPNGWHPHFHLLFGFYTPPNISNFSDDLWKIWKHETGKVGNVVDRGAFDVRIANNDVSEYIAKYGHMPRDEKWSAESEVTRHTVKESKKGLSAFGMLKGLGVPDIKPRFKRQLYLWLREYGEVITGKHQLQSTDLLSLKLNAKKEQEIVDGEAIEYPILASLYPDDWQKVLRNQKRGELLRIASKNDPELLYRFIDKLEK